MLLALIAAATSSANEGMWPPRHLDAHADAMEQAGLRLPAEALQDPQGALLGSIVSLGGCSGSFVSPTGLIATNHHCVAGYLQYNSDAKNNRAETGFTAKSPKEEIWTGPGGSVYITQRVRDVTVLVNKGVKGKTQDVDRRDRVNRNKNKVVRECEEKPNTRCSVRSFYEGQQYILIEQIELKDLRLAYAPPEAVGNYGGSIDNWMWPRHTGDFAFLRAYTAADGSPAAHDSGNVPYLPKHHLSVGKDGVGPGDFVMVAGYPGHTQRHKLHKEMLFYAENEYPWQVGISEAWIDIIENLMVQDPEADALLKAPLLGISNSWKHNKGMLDNFEHGDALERKKEQERLFTEWTAAEEVRAPYASAYDELNGVLQEEQSQRELLRYLGWLRWSSDWISTAHFSYIWAQEQKKSDINRKSGYQERDRSRAIERTQRLEKTHYSQADQELLKYMLLRPEAQAIPPLRALLEEHGGAEFAVYHLFKDESLALPEARIALLDSPLRKLKELDSPWMKLAIALADWEQLSEEDRHRRTGAKRRLAPIVLEGVQASSSQPLYPDANGTLRVTYGQVVGYSPRDAVQYGPQTTVGGMAAKASAPPFDAPKWLLDAAEQSSESGHADDSLGDIPCNFLADLDITGGNSGSATLDAEGRFVGLAFDGNIESLSSKWMFNSELTRSIHVDVRYIQWLMAQQPDAAWLLEEFLGTP
jgi:hypothetical protein